MNILGIDNFYMLKNDLICQTSCLFKCLLKRDLAQFLVEDA